MSHDGSLDQGGPVSRPVTRSPDLAAAAADRYQAVDIKHGWRVALKILGKELGSRSIPLLAGLLQ